MAVTPPVIGSTQPGDLYVDLQTRAIWLGVDPAVDPAEAVLVSDRLGELELIEQAETDAKVYTDGQISTRAPVSHTHTSSQVTDFTAAVQGVVTAMPSVNWVSGMIMMWSGSLASIGTGGLAGWSLCDGSNGTPDLRDRFVIGAGNKLPGVKNPNANATSSSAGSHTHTIDPTVLTTAQLPAHSHGISATGTGTGQTSWDGRHAHILDMAYRTSDSHDGFGRFVSGGGAYQEISNPTTTEALEHQHTVSVNVSVSGTSGNTGTGTGHTHTENATGAHTHTISTAELREASPYYALAYIMKL